MKTLKWTSISLAALLALVLIFYAEEDLRGWNAWQKCKSELVAKGFVMDWDKLIPPPVPDEQNFFKAPEMSDWFVRGAPGAKAFSDRFSNPLTSATNLTAATAETYLAWSDQLEPDFNLIREALKRPYARMDGDYSKPFEIPIPNFINVRIVSQVLAQRAKCHLQLGRPEKALEEVTLLHDLRRLLQGAPTGKPMTLVAAMINVAVTGLYAETIAGGMQSHAWQEPQLAALQKQLADINLTPFVFSALKEEPASLCHTAEIAWIPKLFGMTGHTKWTTKVVWWFWPRGWTYQNMVNVAVLGQKQLEGFDLANDTVAPRKFENASREVEKFFSHSRWPFKILAAIAVPNFTKAEQTTAHNQTMANEAQIVCALERYRLVHGEYPEMLDALVPQFIEQLPHDMIGGQPLQYHRTSDRKFLLYSVGWNEKDDGGEKHQYNNVGRGVDYSQGDWVWQN